MVEGAVLLPVALRLEPMPRVLPALPHLLMVVMAAMVLPAVITQGGQLPIQAAVAVALAVRSAVLQLGAQAAMVV